MAGTVITVSGRGFANPQDLRCNFGSKSVPADYVSSTEIKCTSPTIRLKRKDSGMHVQFWLSGGGEISQAQEFLYHSTLLASDEANDCVHLFDAHHGQFTKTLIQPGAGGLKSPQGIQFGSDGNIYVASQGTNQILKFNVNGQSIGVFAELPKTCSPTAMVFGPDSNLFVSCTGMSKVIALNANSGQQLGTAAQGGGLSLPMGLAFGPGNTLYVVSAGTNQVLRYAQGGYFQGAVTRMEDRGSGIAMNGGSLFVTGGASVENAVLQLEGQRLHAFAESHVLADPYALAFDPAGFLFVSAANNIVRFTDRGMFLGSMAVTGAANACKPTFMALSPREAPRRQGRHDEL